MRVSILARLGGRALPQVYNVGNSDLMFQSSPGLVAGRCVLKYTQ